MDYGYAILGIIAVAALSISIWFAYQNLGLRRELELLKSFREHHVSESQKFINFVRDMKDEEDRSKMEVINVPRFPERSFSPETISIMDKLIEADQTREEELIGEFVKQVMKEVEVRELHDSLTGEKTNVQ